MKTNPLNGRSLFKMAGGRAARYLFSTAAALLLATPLLHAQTSVQLALNAQLAAEHRTVLTANASELATAVTNVIASGTFTADQTVVGALASINGRVNRHNNTNAGAVVAAAIKELNTLNDASFNVDVANLTDDAIDVNFNTHQALGSGGKELAAEDAVATIADLADTNVALLTALTTLSNKLSSDPDLGTGENNILRAGLAGVVGARGTSQVSAPLAAEDFAKGLVGSAVTPSSLVTIMSDEKRNTRVDNFFSYGVGLISSSAQTVAAAEALIASDPSAAAQITQGFAASTGTTANEAARGSFAQAIVVDPALKHDTLRIVEGMAFVDPYYASNFTQDIFTVLPKATVTADAPSIATALGGILGSDGNELTKIAQVYADSIENTTLPASKASTYVLNLVKGAVTSRIKAFPAGPENPLGDQGYGQGPLAAMTTGMTAQPIVQDLASIADQIVSAILIADHSEIIAGGRAAASVSSLIGSVAADVTRYIRNSTISTNTSVDVAAYIAGTIADTVDTMGLTTAQEGAIIAVLKRDVDALVQSSVKTQVNTQLASLGGQTQYAEVGPISAQETPFTNY